MKDYTGVKNGVLRAVESGYIHNKMDVISYVDGYCPTMPIREVVRLMDELQREGKLGA